MERGPSPWKESEGTSRLHLRPQHQDDSHSPSWLRVGFCETRPRAHPSVYWLQQPQVTPEAPGSSCSTRLPAHPRAGQLPSPRLQVSPHSSPANPGAQPGPGPGQLPQTQAFNLPQHQAGSRSPRPPALSSTKLDSADLDSRLAPSTRNCSFPSLETLTLVPSPNVRNYSFSYSPMHFWKEEPLLSLLGLEMQNSYIWV